ncbi:MAG: hypothetical protein ABWW65_01055 [Thermoprotei archaeon]
MTQSYRVLCSGSIDAGEVDLGLVLSVYNFGFWFNGETGVLQLDIGGKILALIDRNGSYKIYSSGNGSDCSIYEDEIEYLLGINEDLSSFHERGASDPLLGAFIRKYRGWRVRSTSLWWALVIGVCQQNASFRQGWTTLYNIVKGYGKRVVLDGYETYLVPTPRDIVNNPEVLVTARTGYRYKTIIGIAEWFLENPGVEEKLVDMGSRSIEEELKSIRGVGSYTARLALILGFRRYDLPPIDRWLRRIASTVYGVDEKSVEEEWTRRWNRYSGLAALATTIALDAEPLTKALQRIRENRLLPEDTGKPTPLTLWKYYK